MKAAKHLLIIFLTIGITMPDAVLHQALRVPALAAHYYHHITEHQSIGVIDFLVLHYGDTDHMQNDEQEHKNLPGTQKNQHCNHAQITPIVLVTSVVLLQNPEPCIKTEPNVCVHQNLPSNNAVSIWQPPKFA